MPCSICERAMHYDCGVENFTRYAPQQLKWFQKVYRLTPVFYNGDDLYTFCPDCQAVLRDEFMGPLVKRLETTARYEDLAQLYEDFGYLVEAGRIRTFWRTQVIKNITLDVNDMMDRLGSAGLAIPYRCPSCGATLNINGETGRAGIRFCQYCGSAINTEVVADLIKQALK